MRKITIAIETVLPPKPFYSHRLRVFKAFAGVTTSIDVRTKVSNLVRYFTQIHHFRLPPKQMIQIQRMRNRLYSVRNDDPAFIESIQHGWTQPRVQNLI